MTKTLLAEFDREALLARIHCLAPTDRPVAGAMTARQMLCHLGDQMATALGDIHADRRDTRITRTLGKWFVLYAPIRIPFGKVNTIPEMQVTQPSSWEADVARLEELIFRFADTEQTAPHAVFGKLSPREWGILAAKHIDHHLRQFKT